MVNSESKARTGLLAQQLLLIAIIARRHDRTNRRRQTVTRRNCVLPLALLALLTQAGPLWSQEATSPSAALTPLDLQTALNLTWVLLCAFLVFLMQAGFALVETGMTRAKNVAHTMAMNVVVFSLGTLGFWA